MEARLVPVAKPRATGHCKDLVEGGRGRRIGEWRQFKEEVVGRGGEW